MILQNTDTSRKASQRHPNSSLFNFSQAPPLSLYIHIPWCLKKCPYCDFNSFVSANRPEQRYLSSLLSDLANQDDAVQGRPIETIFIGGGTPSLLSSATISSLLCGIRSQQKVAENAEITLEANPGTIDTSKLAEFLDAGINRLSIGIQSFQESLLVAIGRIHGRHEALAAVESAFQAGFKNINLDLMFGLPQQSYRQAIDDIATAIALQPAHISYYQMTVEPETSFYANRPLLADDDRIDKIQSSADEQLQKAGFSAYEISNYAQSNRQCQHNLNYWHFGDYAGIGAGAHGKITYPSRIAIMRSWQANHPNTYMRNIATGNTTNAANTTKQLSLDDVILEFMMNALRLNQGVSADLFAQRTGLSVSHAMASIHLAQTQGWLETTPGMIRTTTLGRRFLDSCLLLFS